MFDVIRTVFKYKEKKSPDKLGLYPEAVHTQALPERRYLWTSRILVFFVVFSIALNMILAAILLLMLPERTANVRLLNINKEGNALEQTQPAERRVPVGDLMAEQHIDNYIKHRHTISYDLEEMENRWGQNSTFFWYSSPEVYSQFKGSEYEYYVSLFKSRGLKRDIYVEDISILTTNLWQVDFLTIDWVDAKMEPEITKWKSTLRIAFAPIVFDTKEDLAKNPFGFVVTNYSLAYVGEVEDPKQYIDIIKKMY
jgi:type IV secretory pathway component VirB8